MSTEPAEIHVWFVRPSLLQQGAPVLRRLLSADEKRRAERFHFEADMYRFSVCRGILRVLLGLYLEAAPESIEFVYGPYGKPAVRGNLIYFSVSHSGDGALLAF